MLPVKPLNVETPPRVWGRPPVSVSRWQGNGNTPTCVGKTDDMRTIMEFSRKHPHVCGEDPPIPQARSSPRETPPRVWGRQPGSSAGKNSRRNTPTCVGKTFRHGLFSLLCRKHPHVCGEDYSCLSCFQAVEETPPRVWGRRCVPPLNTMSLGNTPRVWGRLYALTPYSMRGETPHVWGRQPADDGAGGDVEHPTCVGKTIRQIAQSPSIRNTPTCVGKTRPARPDSMTSRKHPHVCGEDEPGAVPPAKSGETPPRVWGRPGHRQLSAHAWGNTPTCVGKTADLSMGYKNCLRFQGAVFPSVFCGRHFSMTSWNPLMSEICLVVWPLVKILKKGGIEMD